MALEPRMFDVPAEDKAVARLSAGVRLTQRNKAKLAAGVHPATGRALLSDGSTCGDCVHHVVIEGAHIFHKCELHRLGLSRSEASDIRLKWPACAAFLKNKTNDVNDV